MSVVSITGYTAANGQFGELAFKSPPQTTVSRAQLWRYAWTYGSGSGGASQRNYLVGLAGGAPFLSEADGGSDAPTGSRGTGDLTTHGIVSSNWLDLNVASRGSGSVSYRVGCGFSAGCPTGHASGPAPNYFAAGVQIFGAVVTVDDPTIPDLQVAGSGLLAGSPVSGVQRVLIQHATDTSGIKRLAVYVDGAATPIGLVDYEQDLNRCTWWKATPCRDVDQVEIPVDTTQLADGQHSVTVKAFDAAGNARTSPTHIVTVRNGSNDPTGPSATESDAAPAGVPNGTEATAGAKLSVVFDQNKKNSVKAPYGRAVVLRGELTDDRGTPIADAQVDYGALATRPGARREDLGSMRTNQRGEFVLTVPTRLGSRQLRFAYRPRLDGPVAVTTDAQLDVLARLSLKVGPKRVLNRHAVTFSGKLAAGPIPRKGKLVNLQVVVDGRWHTFATVRSSKTGKFRYRYRFKRTFRRMTYRFRALSRYEAAYPFVAGHSRTVGVRVN
jgi:hypothetical protein